MYVYGIFAVMVSSIISFVVIIIVIYASRYKKVPPDSVMIIYGKGASENKDGMTIVSSGGKFILPVVQSFEILSLQIRELKILTTDIPINSQQGELLMSLRVTALARVSENVGMMKTAVKRILSKSDQEIEEIARNIMIAHMRKVTGSMDIEWLDAHRDEAAGKIRSSASSELSEIGMEISSLHITEILDQYGYLTAAAEKRGKATEMNLKNVGLV